MLAYIAYANDPISRHDRVLDSKAQIFAAYPGKQQEFLNFVLEQYIYAGISELSRTKLPRLLELKYHDLRAAVRELGSIDLITQAFIGFQPYLYAKKKRDIA